MKKFGDRLKEARKAKGVQQQEVAAYVDMLPRSYRFWEQGTKEPSLEKLVMLADYFDVSLDWLLGRVDER